MLQREIGVEQGGDVRFPDTLERRDCLRVHEMTLVAFQRKNSTIVSVIDFVPSESVGP